MMKVLFLDLETSPNLAHVWSLWEPHVAINQLVSTTEVICFGAKWYGEKNVIFKSQHHDGKKVMLKEMHRLLDEADVVIGWNSASFDTKHMMREFLEAGMLPPSPYKDLDLMRVVKGRFRLPSNKLDFVAQLLKIGKKTQHTGFDLWLGCMRGDEASWKLMKKYQIQDVELLVPLYEKLKPWIKNGPHVGSHNDVIDGCPNCGNVKLERRGFAVTTTGKYQRYQCKGCGSWMRSKSAVTSTTMRSI